MAMGKFIAYYRVSTVRQGRSGLGLDAQRHAVRSYLDGGRWQLLDEIIEIESGTRNDRPELRRALALCRVHRATLVIAKIDRLARNVAFVSALMESNVEFVAADMPHANKLTVHILAAMAEHEAEAISVRTKLALAAAKARGRKLGGDRGNLPAVAALGARTSAEVRRAAAETRARDLAEVIAGLRAEGHVSLRALATALNERDIKAPRGGKWSAAQVAALLKHIDGKIR